MLFLKVGNYNVKQEESQELLYWSPFVSKVYINPIQICPNRLIHTSNHFRTYLGFHIMIQEKQAITVLPKSS